MVPCSRRHQAAKPSSSHASGAAATFHPASGSSPFSPSLLSAPSAANRAGTCHRRSSSVGLTNSSPATEKIVWDLSLKIFQNDTIDIEDSVGVQNRQAGCLPVAMLGLLSNAASGTEPSYSSSACNGTEAGYLGVRPRIRSCA